MDRQLPTKEYYAGSSPVKSSNFFDLGYRRNDIKEIIDFLSKFASISDAVVTCHSDEYSGDRTITVEFPKEFTEEQVLLAIKRRIEATKIAEEQRRIASLSKAERLELEVKKAEKKLARQKKKLEKLSR
jgi:hypothetical protein